VENENLDAGAYLEMVKRIVQLSHARGVSVEAQVGHLPNAAGVGHGEATDPGLARAFVDETGIDALGVAVGNVHILTKGKAPIDEARWRGCVIPSASPWYCNGGTGIPLEALPSLPRLGVAR